MPIPTINISNQANFTNVGNIRYTGEFWQGLIGQNSSGFCVFQNVEYGVRAMVKIICNDYKTDRKTVRLIIEEYAPAVENNVNQYINNVCTYAAVSPDNILSLYDLQRVILGMIKVEKGYIVESADIFVKKYTEEFLNGFFLSEYDYAGISTSAIWGKVIVWCVIFLIVFPYVRSLFNRKIRKLYDYF